MLRMPENLKLYGPYTRKDGRKHVIVITRDESGKIVKRETISYPKFLVEGMLLQELPKGYTVDHNDRDFTNDHPSNLVVRMFSDHIQLDALRVKVSDVQCPMCDKTFTPTVDQRNPRNGIAGPFCSRRCGGLYGAGVQNGASKLDRIELTKEYYRLEK